MRITPDNITKEFILENPNRIFVFGSNEAGIHGKGAEKDAMQIGAKMYEGFGLFGQTYAIPTKNRKLEQLPISQISRYVNCFISFAIVYTKFEFYVTKIGCGLANYTPEQIAPLFADASKLPNVWLPIEFHNIINNQNAKTTNIQ